MSKPSMHVDGDLLNEGGATRIGIVIPMRNCLEFTQAMLETVRTRHPHSIYVIDDHSDAETKRWLAAKEDIVSFIDPPGSTGLAWNWNLGISAALCDGCSHVLVANNDILLHPLAIDNMAERLDRGDVIVVTGDDIAERCRRPEDVFDWPPEDDESGRLDFSCFMLTAEAIRRVGWFDEGFLGAYYEDNDYYARLLHSGERAVRLGLAPYFHHSMRTVNGNPDVSLLIQQRAGRNGAYFREKWGRLPANSPDEMRETYYSFPFNRESEQDAWTAGRRLERLYRMAADDPSQSKEHLDLIYRFASAVNNVLVIGSGHSLSALAYAHPKRLCAVGYSRGAINTRIEAAARMEGVEFVHMDAAMTSDRRHSAELVLLESDYVAGGFTMASFADNPDTLMIDRILSGSARILILRGVEASNMCVEPSGKENAWSLVARYMKSHPQWRLQAHLVDDGGLTVFAR